MKILNIHDLGQDGKNICYNELLKYWTARQVVSRTYNLAEENPASVLLDCMTSGPYDLIVGTGFGGVLALLAGRATGVRTILVNPMYPIQQYLPTELPDYDHGSTLEKYEHNKICWDTKRDSLKNVFLILGRDDDITDTARTPYYFYKGNARFVEGGHFPDGEDFVQAFGELSGGVAKETSETEEGEQYASEGGIVIDMKMIGVEEGPSDSEYLRDMEVDDVDTSNGHIVIYWSHHDEKPKEHALYLYYADGKWRRDEEDGFGMSEERAAMILSKASGQIITQTDYAKHDAHDFWGWMW